MRLKASTNRRAGPRPLSPAMQQQRPSAPARGRPAAWAAGGPPMAAPTRMPAGAPPSSRRGAVTRRDAASSGGSTGRAGPAVPAPAPAPGPTAAARGPPAAKAGTSAVPPAAAAKPASGGATATATKPPPAPASAAAEASNGSAAAGPASSPSSRSSGSPPPKVTFDVAMAAKINAARELARRLAEEKQVANKGLDGESGSGSGSGSGISPWVHPGVKAGLNKWEEIVVFDMEPAQGIQSSGEWWVLSLEMPPDLFRFDYVIQVVTDRRKPDITAVPAAERQGNVFTWCGGAPRPGQRCFLAYNRIQSGGAGGLPHAAGIKVHLGYDGWWNKITQHRAALLADGKERARHCFHIKVEGCDANARCCNMGMKKVELSVQNQCRQSVKLALLDGRSYPWSFTQNVNNGQTFTTFKLSSLAMEKPDVNDGMPLCIILTEPCQTLADFCYAPTGGDWCRYTFFSTDELYRLRRQRKRLFQLGHAAFRPAASSRGALLLAEAEPQALRALYCESYDGSGDGGGEARSMEP
ncbi:hypothetical protein TSOC_001881 [Tetrabaena socialis]|uniref:Pherophorin domain-containing protein n=1 Tax=Tetrabaena socialis TaxID=47790 RepID=A0A2J8AFG0_9CHLO|nr:hypothetical protein TSOC_001881 [Tetrabaena socialis]|eukprot:PNH11258.1 hypothetical protein TSOC_001881 [Tetrabaena socialis]